MGNIDSFSIRDTYILISFIDCWLGVGKSTHMAFIQHYLSTQSSWLETEQQTKSLSSWMLGGIKLLVKWNSKWLISSSEGKNFVFFYGKLHWAVIRRKKNRHLILRATVKNKWRPMTDSWWGLVETNTILYSNYPSIKNKLKKNRW